MRAEDADELWAYAAEFARGLPHGAVVYLVGPMGAGKTTFVQGACAALGVRERVTSPTYTVAHLYEGRVAHLDLSRSERLDEQAWGDLEPYFEDVRAVFVEWPEAGAGLVPPPDATVRITPLADGSRVVEVRASADG